MKNIKHHTVSKCYLRGFADKNGRNWVLSLKSRKIYPCNPKDVLTGNHFYTIRFPTGGGSLVVEDTLASIENVFVGILRGRIQKRQSISPQERAMMSVFMGAMSFRTKSRRSSISRFVNDVKRVVGAMNKLTLEEKRRAAPLSIDTGMPSFSANDFIKETSDIGSFHSKMLLKILPDISNYIYQMRWCILETKDSAIKFFTSDNPFALLNPVLINRYGFGAIGSSPGLAQKDVELVFPLSSSFCILAGWNLNSEDYFDSDDLWINKMNERIMMCAHESLICENHAQLETVSKRFPKQ